MKDQKFFTSKIKQKKGCSWKRNGKNVDPTSIACTGSQTYVTTNKPSTKAPTTKAPTTRAPTTIASTTKSTTTKAPTTKAPTTKAPTMSPSTTTTQKSSTDSCPLGADIPGVPKGEITMYSSNPSGGNCDFNWSKFESSGLDGWVNYAALPKGDKKFDRYEMGANCGRCVRLRCSCEQSVFNGEGGILQACQVKNL